MNQSKVLSKTQTGEDYKNDNNLEVISVITPLTYNNFDLKLCTLQLNIIHPYGVGDVINLVNPVELDNGYMKFSVPITKEITFRAGDIEIWLKIVSGVEVVGRTNSVFHEIKDVKNIENYIPQQQLSVLDQWTLLMQETNAAAQQALLDAQAQAVLAKSYADQANQALQELLSRL